MKKIIILCAALIGATITAADKPTQIRNIHPFIKGFGIGVGTGAVSGVCKEMILAENIYLKPRQLNDFTKGLVISGAQTISLFSAEYGARWALTKHMSEHPSEENQMWWGSRVGSWCGFLFANHLYSKYGR